MTNIKTILSASALAFLATGATAQSVPQSVIDAIAAELGAQGFSRIEIDIERDGIDVDAYGPGIEGDFEFTRAGQLVYSDIDTEETRNVGSGVVMSAYLDDDDYDDDDYEYEYEAEGSWSESDDDDDDDEDDNYDDD